MKKFKILKNSKLTETEKKALFDRITARIREIPENAGAEFRYPVPSPFFKFTFSHYSVYMKAGVTAVFVLLVSGSTSLASLGSLPGDLLYGVKVNVVEKVAGLAARTPESRAKVETLRIETRMKEFEELAETGRLTVEQSRELEKNIEEKLEKFDENVAAIAAEPGAEELKQEVKDELEKKLEEHVETIVTVRQEMSEQGIEAEKPVLESILERLTDEPEGEDQLDDGREKGDNEDKKEDAKDDKEKGSEIGGELEGDSLPKEGLDGALPDSSGENLDL